MRLRHQCPGVPTEVRQWLGSPSPQPSGLLGLPRLVSSCRSHKCECTEKAKSKPPANMLASCLDVGTSQTGNLPPKVQAHWELLQMIWTESQTGQNQLGCADRGCTLTNGTDTSPVSSGVSVRKKPHPGSWVLCCHPLVAVHGSATLGAE